MPAPSHGKGAVARSQAVAQCLHHGHWVPQGQQVAYPLSHCRLFIWIRGQLPAHGRRRTSGMGSVDPGGPSISTGVFGDLCFRAKGLDPLGQPPGKAQGPSCNLKAEK